MTTHSRLAALEAAVAAANDRLNAVDETVAKAASDADAAAKQAAADAVDALDTRVTAIEADLNTDGPATPAPVDTPAPAIDPATGLAA